MRSPGLTGDGAEYILQVVAFQNHLSFGITVEDAEQAKLMISLVGAYPLWVFYITNFLLYVIALLVVFFFLKTERRKN